jgi:heptaprenylglyceryl phosphate synthase
VLEARRLEIETPIVAGNGIQRRSDVALLRKAGADAIAIGTVAMVRPWRMAAIIEEALQAA